MKRLSPKLVICLLLMLALFIPTGWTNDLSDEEKAKRVSDAHFEMDTNPELKYGMSPIYVNDVKEGTYNPVLRAQFINLVKDSLETLSD